jgi:hypothetical protein
LLIKLPSSPRTQAPMRTYEVGTPQRFRRSFRQTFSSAQTQGTAICDRCWAFSASPTVRTGELASLPAMQSSQTPREPPWRNQRGFLQVVLQNYYCSKRKNALACSGVLLIFPEERTESFGWCASDVLGVWLRFRNFPSFLLGCRSSCMVAQSFPVGIFPGVATMH